MDVQDYIVYAIVFLCIVYAGKHFAAFFRKGKQTDCGCGCGCPGCTQGNKTVCPDKKGEKEHTHL